VYAGFARRIVRAFGKRIGAGDVAALPELVALRDEIDEAIVKAVEELRAEPWSYSWQQIADVLGITRQAAQQKYGPKTAKGARQVGGQPGNLR
jgi:hypothetical protein